MHVLDELMARGFVQQVSDPVALRAALDAGPLACYVGFDPTADSLHVGNLVSLLLLGHLQRAGHRTVLVVGGGTGMVGDPSGKTEARQLLDAAAVRRNLEAQRGQMARFVDLSSADRGLVLDNADWLLELRYIDFLRDIGSCFSVNRMLTAEGYRQRLDRGQGLSFIEFNYQLLQAYDFLVLNERHGVRLQMGGNDQWGNILAGVDLVRRKTGAEVFGLTTPLVTTASGQKMGKTHAGAVWLDEARTPPFDFFQYWLNVDDRDVGRFLRMFTLLPLDEIARLEGLVGAEVRQAKRALAREITALVHGPEAAAAAEMAAHAMVAGEAADELPTYVLSVAAPLPVVLADAGLASSRSDARRALQGGGVRLDQARVDDLEQILDPVALSADGVVLRVGKKRAVRVVPG